MPGTGNQPLVSIGMPVYNSERYVRRALDSLLAQTYTNLQIVISDNASTDATFAICQEYAAKDSRIILMQFDVNRGVIANFNAVLAEATGLYFKAMSSHDAIAPTFIETGMRVLQSNPEAVLYYTVVRKFDDQDRLNGQYQDGFELLERDPMARFESLQKRLKVNNPMYGLVRTASLKRTGFLRPCLASDVIAMAELSLHGKFIMGTEPLMMRRIDPLKGYTSDDYRQELAFCTGQPVRPRPPMVFIRINIEYLLACSRARLSIGQRARLGWFVLRNVYWVRHKILNELREQFEFFTGGVRQSVSRSEISL